MAVYSPPTYLHDPDAVLDYPIDWSDWLDDINDTIASATVTVTAGPDGDLNIDLFTNTVATGTPWISWSGATMSTAKYTVTMHVITTGLREDDRSIYIKLKER